MFFVIFSGVIFASCLAVFFTRPIFIFFALDITFLITLGFLFLMAVMNIETVEAKLDNKFPIAAEKARIAVVSLAVISGSIFLLIAALPILAKANIIFHNIIDALYLM